MKPSKILPIVSSSKKYENQITSVTWNTIYNREYDEKVVEIGKNI